VTHEVKTTIIGNESSDLLSVLDELDTDTLSDSRVGLLGLNTDLGSQHDVPFVLFIFSTVRPVSSGESREFLCLKFPVLHSLPSALDLQMKLH
jgi:hypothetical protein